MRMFLRNLSLGLFLAVSFFLDDQLSFWLSRGLGAGRYFSSHLLLALLFILLPSLSRRWLLLTCLFFGFLWDNYYLNQLGVMILVLPLLTILFSFSPREFFQKSIPSLLLFIVYLFCVDSLVWLFALVLSLANFDPLAFVANDLALTFLINIPLFFLIRWFYQVIFKD